MNRLYGGYRDMEVMEREDAKRNLENLKEAQMRTNDEQLSPVTETLPDALDRECAETMHEVYVTEKLLCDIVMRYIGEPPKGHPEIAPAQPVAPGAVNSALQTLRDMRTKLSFMREDVSRLL